MSLRSERPPAAIETLPESTGLGALGRIAELPGRVTRKAIRHSKGLVEVQKFKRHAEITPRDDLLTLGSVGYGAWTVPERLLNSESVCYLIGVGADTTFDEALMDKFGIPKVWAFDPTDGSAEHAKQVRLKRPGYSFLQAGISDRDGQELFYEPNHPGGISLLASGEKVAGSFPVRSLDSVLQENGHSKEPDLVKICAEGFEYKITRAMLYQGIRPKVLCVEYARSHPGEDPKENFDLLVEAGYKLVATHLPPGNDWKVTYVRDQ